MPKGEFWNVRQVQELARLRLDNERRLTAADIGKRLGRSVFAVKAQAARMGIRKPPSDDRRKPNGSRIRTN